MAQFASFIAGETIASGLPSDWTQELGTFTAQIVADATTSGGTDRILNTSADSVSGHISWNTAGTISDQEILTLTNFTGPVANATIYFTALGRLTTPGHITGYSLAFLSNSTGGGVVWHFDRLDDGTAVVVGSDVSFTWVTGTWYWSRLRINGTTLFGKVWTLGNPEPRDWGTATTDTTYASGKTGHRFVTIGTNIAFFSAASGTDSAPSVPGMMVVPK